MLFTLGKYGHDHAETTVSMSCGKRLREASFGLFGPFRKIALSRTFRVILLGVVVWIIVEAACGQSALIRQLAPSSES